MATKKSTSAARAKAREAAQKRVGSTGYGVTRMAPRGKDALRLRHQEPGVDHQLLEDQQLRIFKLTVLSEMFDAAVVVDESQSCAIAIKIPSRLLRLLNGRREAYFAGRVKNVHLELVGMLSNEEAEAIKW